MTVTTSRGKTIPIDWMYAQQRGIETLMIGLHDSRPLRDILADFEGCECFHRKSEAEGDMDFEGYTVPIIASKNDYGYDSSSVLVTLARPAKE